MDLQISLGAGLLPLFKIGLTVCIRQEPNALSLPWWVVSERFHAKGFPVCPGGMTRGRKRQSSLLFLKKPKMPSILTTFTISQLTIGGASVWLPPKWQGFYSLGSLAVSFMYLEFCIILYELYIEQYNLEGYLYLNKNLPAPR